MEITPSNIDAIFINFLKTWQDAYTEAVPWYQRLASEFPSNTRENRYMWVDKIPRLRRWIGERVYNNLSARSYALVNDDYEDSIKLNRNVIDDDQYGLYGVGVKMMGEAARHWPDDMLATVLQGGSAATALCFDGQPFFNASHPVNIDNPTQYTVQSNLFSTATTGACALTPANYNLVRSTMMAYKGADGKPLGIVPDTLVVPPALEVNAKQILNADFVAPAAAVGSNAANTVQTNVLKGTADILMVPQFAGTDTTWFLAQTKGVLKPFVFQQRQAPRFVIFDKPTDVNVAERREYKMGVDARGACGYSLWFLAAMAVG